MTLPLVVHALCSVACSEIIVFLDLHTLTVQRHVSRAGGALLVWVAMSPLRLLRV